MFDCGIVKIGYEFVFIDIEFYLSFKIVVVIKVIFFIRIIIIELIKIDEEYVICYKNYL